MNPKTNSLPMRELIEQSLSRRSFVHILTSGACVAALTELDVHASAPETRKTSQMFQFRSIPPSIEDRVVVPEGYTAEVLYRWGDPINGESPAFQPNASNSADEQEKQAGMGHDGMEFFPLPGFDPNERGLLASTPTKFYCSQTVSNHFLPSRCQWKKFESRSHRMVSRSSRLQNKKMVAGK